MKEKIKKLLPKNRFARAVSVLAGGTVAAQTITVLASPILTRLYSPEDFGLLAVYASLLSMMGVVSTLRYQLAIPLPEDDQQAADLVILCLIIVCCLSLISGIATFFWGEQISILLNIPDLVRYIWLLPFGLFFMGVYQIFNYWAYRDKHFTLVARTKLTQSVSMVLIQLGGYAFAPFSLLLGHMSGQAAGVSSLWFALVRKHKKKLLSSSWKNIKLIAFRHWRFPAFSTWTGLCNTGAAQLPPVFFAAFFGVGVAGVYALTHKVLSVPMSLIGRAVGDVFYSEAAQANRDNQLGTLVTNVHQQLVSLAMPAGALFFVTAPFMFTIIFGDNWKQAGLFAQIMTPWLYFNFIVSPSTRIFPILDRHGTALVFQLSLLLSSLAAIFIGSIVFDSIFISLVIMSSANSLIYLSRLIQSFVITGANPLLIFTNHLNQLLPTTLTILPYISMKLIVEIWEYSDYLNIIGFILSLIVMFYILLNLSKKAYAT